MGERRQCGCIGFEFCRQCVADEGAKDARECAKVFKMPLAKTDTPDGPLYATEVDGVVVHGGTPVTPESEAAISEIIKAARKYMAARPSTDKEGGNG